MAKIYFSKQNWSNTSKLKTWIVACSQAVLFRIAFLGRQFLWSVLLLLLAIYVMAVYVTQAATAYRIEQPSGTYAEEIGRWWGSMSGTPRTPWMFFCEHFPKSYEKYREFYYFCWKTFFVPTFVHELKFLLKTLSKIEQFSSNSKK